MYGVRCPHCYQLLRLSRPVQNARLRCRNCGALFTGSTTEYPDNAPPPAEVLGPASGSPPVGGRIAPPARATPGVPGVPGIPPAQRPIPRVVHKQSSTVVIIGAICGVGALAVLIGALYMGGRVHHVEYDEGGRVIFDQWISRDEQAARLRKIEEDKKPRERPEPAEGPGKTPARPAPRSREPGPDDILIGPMEKGDSKPGPARTTPGTEPPSETTPKTPAPSDATTPAPSNPPDTARTGPPPEGETELPKSDPNIGVRPAGTPVTREEMGSNGYFVGHVDNKYDTPLQSVTIDVYSYDANGKRSGPYSTQCSFVPAKGAIRFCVAYSGKERNDIQTIRAVARDVSKAAENVVSWSVADNAVSRGVEDRNVVFTAEIANPNPFTVRGISVYYDLYDQEGVLIGSPGSSRSTKLRDSGDRLIGRADDRIKIVVDPRDVSVVSDLIQSAVVRVWGTK